MTRPTSINIPDAWPALMTRDMVAAYTMMSVSTLLKVCPVAPVDLGAGIVRYRRDDLDVWIRTLPLRLPRVARAAPYTADGDAAYLSTADERRALALERARRRTYESLRWPK
jgi:hypothetical protein